ncbi:cation diffusion facilitator family transporter [Mesorhizobium soli]|uniref:cation-efflux pump n=1 Tax=Pseudaminobacter soli (ex Li et al. 2025) TaxID=1295366 RepID=UPI002473A847|nr:cation-efflux pump [Mesorhizobium soli]MDH6234525.1 cation diffusion facilitator family transporter [Mesorhizobium soli]
MQKDKERVALISMLSSASLAIGKFAIGFMTGSIGLISEGVHSSSDFVATLVTWWAVRVSGKPADDAHHYGYGKVESVAALFEVVLLLGAAGWIAYVALRRLFSEPHQIEAAPVAIAVLVVSIVVDLWRVRALRRVAKATGSPALAADALHFLSDMLASCVVLVGMVFVTLGYWSADAMAALIVAGFIVVAALKLGRQAFASLVDAAPEGASAAVTAAVTGVPHVMAVERTRVRLAGATPFVDLLIAVSRALPLDHVADVKSQVVLAVHGQLPNAEVTVETIARADDDESIETQVRVIAANQGAAIHRLTVQRMDGRLSISLDIEVDADLSVDEAHAVASDLETAIRAELGGDTEIDTHIEPKAAEWLDGGEASSEDRRLIEQSLIQAAKQGGVVDDVHNVRIRNTSIGLIVNFHCRLPPRMSVTEAHTAVDQLERTVRALHPNVGRVIGHAEPSV